MTNKNLTRVIALLLAAAALACGLAACGKPEGDTSPAGSSYISSDAPSEPETSDIGDTSVSEPEISEPDISSDSSAPVDPGPDPADMERLFDGYSDVLTDIYPWGGADENTSSHYLYRFSSHTLSEALYRVAFPEYKGDPDYFESVIKPYMFKNYPKLFDIRGEEDQLPYVYYFIRQFKISKEQFTAINESIKRGENINPTDMHETKYVRTVEDLAFSDEEIKYLYYETDDLDIIRSHLCGKTVWVAAERLYSWDDMVYLSRKHDLEFYSSSWEELYMKPYREYYEKRLATPGVSEELRNEYQKILTQMLYIRRVRDPLSD